MWIWFYIVSLVEMSRPHHGFTIKYTVAIHALLFITRVSISDGIKEKDGSS